MYKRIGAIVQARMGSRRLPGKVLKAFPGGSILEVIIRKLLLWAETDANRFVAVATTDQAIDDSIVKRAGALGAVVVRGDEHDVLGRMTRAAELGHYDIVIRVTADNPFLDIQLLERIMVEFTRQNADYAFVSGAPVGVGAEVVRMDCMRVADSQAHDSYQREHVTPFITDNPHFRAIWLQEKPDVSRFNLSVDTPEQFNRAHAVASELGARVLRCSYQEILDVITRNRLEFIYEDQESTSGANRNGS